MKNRLDHNALDQITGGRIEVTEKEYYGKKGTFYCVYNDKTGKLVYQTPDYLEARAAEYWNNQYSGD